MLVLNRKLGETIVIGHGEIVIRVEQLGRARVSLSIDAPAQVAVHRGEVEDKIQGGGKDAARNPR